MPGDLPNFWEAVTKAQAEGAIMGYHAFLHADRHAEPECERCRYFFDVISPEAYRRFEEEKS